MSSALENEDLENVPLVRMEDVQPSRARIERAVDTPSSHTDDEEIFETCIIEKEEYENDCEVDDDSDSNIGSMVSIQSEEIPDDDDDDEDEGEGEEEEEDSDSGELIVPEVLDQPITINIPKIIREEKIEAKPNGPDSWPTLEILPGGVIKNSIECEGDAFPTKTQCNTTPAQGDMVYACAKCSQAFKYLFCLVKHVKWHEDQSKCLNDPKLRKLTPLQKELILIKKERNELDKTYKKQKVEVLARIAAAIGKINNANVFFNK